ncbi:MAG: hypothetical protein U1F68_12790 [Gammaproteobacteria bacterium]
MDTTKPLTRKLTAIFYAGDAIGAKLPMDYEFIGEQRVKNINHLVRVYRVIGPPRSPPLPLLQSRKTHRPTLRPR